MADKNLVEFVRAALAAGSSRADIAAALAQAGWPPGQIQAALECFAPVEFATPVPRPQLSVSAREAFLYLLIFLLLAIAVGHFGSLCFILIDLFLPAPDASPDRLYWTERWIRWAVSALTVTWPLFLVVTARVNRARRRNPAMQRSSVRRWLTYLALVIAAAVIIGDAIAVIYSFLSGDLTAKFLLKALVLALIAGAVFIYYLQDAERDEGGRFRLSLLLAVASTLAIVAAMALGLAAIDSPQTARERRLDEGTMNHLAAVAGAIDCYWSVEQRLPTSLMALQARYAEGFTLPSAGDYARNCYIGEFNDPALINAVRYAPGDEASYQLCATFQRASDWRDESHYRSFGGPSSRRFPAQHPAGDHCFALTARAIP